jgi:rubredoxin
MKCSLCGYEFNEKEAEGTCKNCPIMKGCRLIKCPNCGFEIPAQEPKWLKYFKKERKTNENKR